MLLCCEGRPSSTNQCAATTARDGVLRGVFTPDDCGSGDGDAGCGDAAAAAAAAMLCLQPLAVASAANVPRSSGTCDSAARYVIPVWSRRDASAGVCCRVPSGGEEKPLTVFTTPKRVDEYRTRLPSRSVKDTKVGSADGVRTDSRRGSAARLVVERTAADPCRDSFRAPSALDTDEVDGWLTSGASNECERWRLATGEQERMSVRSALRVSSSLMGASQLTPARMASCALSSFRFCCCSSTSRSASAFFSSLTLPSSSATCSSLRGCCCCCCCCRAAAARAASAGFDASFSSDIADVSATFAMSTPRIMPTCDDALPSFEVAGDITRTKPRPPAFGLSRIIFTSFLRVRLSFSSLPIRFTFRFSSFCSPATFASPLLSASSLCSASTCDRSFSFSPARFSSAAAAAAAGSDARRADDATDTASPISDRGTAAAAADAGVVGSTGSGTPLRSECGMDTTDTTEPCRDSRVCVCACDPRLARLACEPSRGTPPPTVDVRDRTDAVAGTPAAGDSGVRGAAPSGAAAAAEGGSCDAADTCDACERAEL
eukprot:Rhum_TRINITY_DN7167_c0_g1::Rhum_TRINITY_DN7167_c0_g1_i1::g.21972::m.21972